MVDLPHVEGDPVAAANSEGASVPANANSITFHWYFKSRLIDVQTKEVIYEITWERVELWTKDSDGSWSSSGSNTNGSGSTR
jgi:hypothetical protein